MNFPKRRVALSGASVQPVVPDASPAAPPVPDPTPVVHVPSPVTAPPAPALVTPTMPAPPAPVLVTPIMPAPPAPAATLSASAGPIDFADLLERQAALRFELTRLVKREIADFTTILKRSSDSVDAKMAIAIAQAIISDKLVKESALEDLKAELVAASLVTTAAEKTATSKALDDLKTELVTANAAERAITEQALEDLKAVLAADKALATQAVVDLKAELALEKAGANKVLEDLKAVLAADKALATQAVVDLKAELALEKAGANKVLEDLKAELEAANATGIASERAITDKALIGLKAELEAANATGIATGKVGADKALEDLKAELTAANLKVSNALHALEAKVDGETASTSVTVLDIRRVIQCAEERSARDHATFSARVGSLESVGGPTPVPAAGAGSIPDPAVLARIAALETLTRDIPSISSLGDSIAEHDRVVAGLVADSVKRDEEAVSRHRDVNNSIASVIRCAQEEFERVNGLFGGIDTAYTTIDGVLRTVVADVGSGSVKLETVFRDLEVVDMRIGLLESACDPSTVELPSASVTSTVTNVEFALVAALVHPGVHLASSAASVSEEASVDGYSPSLVFDRDEAAKPVAMVDGSEKSFDPDHTPSIFSEPVSYVIYLTAHCTRHDVDLNDSIRSLFKLVHGISVSEDIATDEWFDRVSKRVELYPEMAPALFPAEIKESDDLDPAWFVGRRMMFLENILTDFNHRCNFTPDETFLSGKLWPIIVGNLLTYDENFPWVKATRAAFAFE
jgi:hypothetical protein